MKEAVFYEQKGAHLNCLLCPHSCVIAEGKFGWCRTRKHVGGKLYYQLYGTIIAEHIDPVEKKPLFHFFPGSRTYSIAAPGCNLQCSFCQNWQISQLDRVSSEKTKEGDTAPEDIIRRTQKAGLNSISYTYSEPTVAYEFVYECAAQAKKQGMFNIMVSNGYLNPQPLKRLLGYVDAFNIDLKAMDDTFYRTICKGTLQPVLDSLIAVRKAGRWLEVTNLLIPGLNTADEQIEKLIGFVKADLGEDVPVHFSGFYPAYALNDIAATSPEILERACVIAEKHGLKYVYAGNVRLAGRENTHCPACHKEVIVRQGYTVLNRHLSGNKCAFCSAVIAGVFG